MNAVQATRLNEIYIYILTEITVLEFFTPRQLLAIRYNYIQWKQKSYTTFCADGTENEFYM